MLLMLLALVISPAAPAAQMPAHLANAFGARHPCCGSHAADAFGARHPCCCSCCSSSLQMIPMSVILAGAHVAERAGPATGTVLDNLTGKSIFQNLSICQFSNGGVYQLSWCSCESTACGSWQAMIWSPPSSQGLDATMAALASMVAIYLHQLQAPAPGYSRRTAALPFFRLQGSNPQVTLK
eukprot:1161755-Pelagomonas_calceolata.AAC.13